MGHTGLLAFLLHGLRAVRYRVTGVVGKAAFRAQGVRYGERLVLKGIPLVKCVPGSTITIGNDVMMISYSMDTALGVNHAVKMETLEPGAAILIGDHVGISGGTLCSVTRIEIGSRCMFGANVMVVDSDFHPLLTGWRRYRSEDVQSSPVVLEENVFLGANVSVLKGVRIGRNSVIGAGSVVIADVPANAVAMGNPARVLRLFSEEEIRQIESDS